MGMSIPSAGSASSMTGVSYMQQQQMQSQMQTLLSSTQTTAPEPVSKPVGNVGNNINTTA